MNENYSVPIWIRAIAVLIFVAVIGFFIYDLGSSEPVMGTMGIEGYVDKPFELVGSNGGLTIFIAFCIFCCILWGAFQIFNEVGFVFGNRSNGDRGYGGRIKWSFIIALILFIIFMMISGDKQPTDSQVWGQDERGHRIIVEKPGIIVPSYTYKGKVYHNVRMIKMDDGTLEMSYDQTGTVEDNIGHLAKPGCCNN